MKNAINENETHQAGSRCNGLEKNTYRRSTWRNIRVNLKSRLQKQNFKNNTPSFRKRKQKKHNKTSPESQELLVTEGEVSKCYNPMQTMTSPVKVCSRITFYRVINHLLDLVSCLASFRINFLLRNLINRNIQNLIRPLWKVCV